MFVKMCVELLDSLGGLDRAALLLADGLDDDGQAGDGGQHGAQNLSLQNLLGGQRPGTGPCRP